MSIYPHSCDQDGPIDGCWRCGPKRTIEEKLAARLWAQCSPAVAALRKVLAQLTK